MNSCQSFAKTLTIGFSGSGLGDLHFFGVAMLLLFLHKLHMVLTVGQLKQFFMLNLKHLLKRIFIEIAIGDIQQSLVHFGHYFLPFLSLNRRI